MTYTCLNFYSLSNLHYKWKKLSVQNVQLGKLKYAKCILIYCAFNTRVLFQCIGQLTRYTDMLEAATSERTWTFVFAKIILLYTDMYHNICTDNVIACAHCQADKQ